MPRRVGYSRRPRRAPRRRRRLVDNPTKAVGFPRVVHSPQNLRLSQLSSPMTHFQAAAQVAEAVHNWSKMAGMLKAKTNVKALKQTNLVKRGNVNNKHNRHEELNTFQANDKVPTGKGRGKTNPNGVLTTHGVGRVPRWKLKRLNKYKHDIFQTVLLSKSNRLAGSQNFLETSISL